MNKATHKLLSTKRNIFFFSFRFLFASRTVSAILFMFALKMSVFSFVRCLMNTNEIIFHTFHFSASNETICSLIRNIQRVNTANINIMG